MFLLKCPLMVLHTHHVSLTADKEMSEKFAPISLGQGQGPKAITMIKDAQVAGTAEFCFHLCSVSSEDNSHCEN